MPLSPASLDVGDAPHSVVTRPVVKISAANVEMTRHIIYASRFSQYEMNLCVMFHINDTACDDNNKKTNRWCFPNVHPAVLYFEMITDNSSYTLFLTAMTKPGRRRFS